jgi:XRE family transcriptional regulator, regulator of sulfur utilization
MKKELAERIRSRRASKGLKQEDIAEQLGIAIGTYSNIERGKTDITVSRLYEIANILNESIYDFLPENNVQRIVRDPEENKIQPISEEKLREEIRKILLEEIAKSNVDYSKGKKSNKK